LFQTRSAKSSAKPEIVDARVWAWLAPLHEQILRPLKGLFEKANNRG
jgi:hypothetical protein